MKNTIGGILKIISKYRVIILTLSLFLLIFSAIFYLPKNFYIILKFSDSGPLHKNMPVYYKGCKIANTKNIWLSEDYKYTFVKIVFKKKPKLSENTTAKIKTLSVKKNYIDLISEEGSSSNLLKNGSIIEGEGAFDIESFLSDIADSGLVIPLIEHFSDAAVSLSQTSEEIKNFFSDSRSMLKDNKNNLKNTTESLVEMSDSLKEVSTRINNSVTNDKVKNTTKNIDKSSSNILEATEDIKVIIKNVKGATGNIDKTIDNIDSTVCNANAITCDVKVMTKGLRQIMAKRFAGLKIFFGKPLEK